MKILILDGFCTPRGQPGIADDKFHVLGYAIP